MSEITNFYMSWLSGQAFGANSVRVRDQEPLIFKPTDISGCRIWLDANDANTVITNELLFVSSFVNKGTLNFQFDISGNQPVIYGSTIVNGLNTLSFTPDSFMQSAFALDFQPRSLFIVTKENSVPASNANPWLASDTSNGMEVFSLTNGTQTYFLGKHPSPIPELAFETSTIYTGYPALVEFINSTDSNDNWMGVNTTKSVPIYSVNASGYNQSNIPYYLGGYFSGSTVASSQDFCELILYEGALNPYLREEVEKYLMTKWAITTPPPPPPPPFSPSSISGLYLWMDAQNSNTLTLSGSNVSSWSNQGLAGSSFDAACNTAYSVTDNNGFSWVQMPTQTTLESYMQLPYYSRTAFGVFQNLTPLDTILYPYENLINTDVETGRQIGVNFDGMSSNYAMAMCQQAQNCPIAATLPVPIGTGDTNLLIMGLLSNTSASNVGYWNGGSNLNTSTDVGNLFSQNPITYYMGTYVSDSPAFRIGEILEYNTLLSPSEISTVANYLTVKWAISSFSPLI